MQHDFNVDGNQSFPAFETDLNNALASLATTSSGNTAPSTTFANQLWIDTSASPPLIKVRNPGNSAWVTLGKADVNLGLVPSDIGAAPLASPGLTGTPTAPTASGGTNTTQLATTAFVQTAVSPKANIASPGLTGTPTAPTATGGTNTTQLATTAFVQTAVSPKADSSSVTSSLGLKANIASPALTGTPTAPTQSAADNSTAIATTAFMWSNFAATAGAGGQVKYRTPLFSIIAATQVVALDGSANFAINFTNPFSSLISVVAVNGDAVVTSISPNIFNQSASGFGINVPGRASTSYRVNWIAIGVG